MGKHSAYWQRYQQAQVRGALAIFVAIAVSVGLVVLAVLMQEALAGAFPYVLGGVVVGMVAAILYLSRNVYKVVCPECATRYERSKWGGQCPFCGLKLLQSDP